MDEAHYNAPMFEHGLKVIWHDDDNDDDCMIFEIGDNKKAVTVRQFLDAITAGFKAAPLGFGWSIEYRGMRRVRDPRCMPEIQFSVTELR